MAITYSTNHVSQTDGVGNPITSGTLSVLPNDFITVTYIVDDSSFVTSWSISNNNTPIAWNTVKILNAASQSLVVLFSGVAYGL